MNLINNTLNKIFGHRPTVFINKNLCLRKPLKYANGVVMQRGHLNLKHLNKEEIDTVLTEALDLYPEHKQSFMTDVSACLEVARKYGINLEISIKSDGSIWAGTGYNPEPNELTYKRGVHPAAEICRVLLDHLGIDLVA